MIMYTQTDNTFIDSPIIFIIDDAKNIAEEEKKNIKNATTLK